MTDKEILEKAIRKAINGGLPMRYQKLKSFKFYEIETDGYAEDSMYGYIKQISSGEPRIERQWFSNEELIFNKDFAKALWGEYLPSSYKKHNLLVSNNDWHKKIHEDLGDKISSDDMEKWFSLNFKCKDCHKIIRTYDDSQKNCGATNTQGNIGWEYHLQQMVISEDPIKYLGEHLDD